VRENERLLLSGGLLPKSEGGEQEKQKSDACDGGTSPARRMKTQEVYSRSAIPFVIHPGGFEGGVGWFWALMPGAILGLPFADRVYKIAPNAERLVLWQSSRLFIQEKNRMR
jgi:hypothetical protein